MRSLFDVRPSSGVEASENARACPLGGGADEGRVSDLVAAV